MMLSSLVVQIRMLGNAEVPRADIGWVPPQLSAHAALDLVDFRLELGLPVWRYARYGVVVERRVVVQHGYNTALLVHRLIAGAPARLEMRPAIQFRGHDEPVSTAIPPAHPLPAIGVPPD